MITMDTEDKDLQRDEEEEEAILDELSKQNQREDVDEYTEKYFDVDVHSAAAYGEYETILDHLSGLIENEKEEKINEEDSFGCTALMEACKHGRQKAAETLIEHGAKVTTVDAFGRTALHYSCATGVESIASVLVEHGADVNAKDSGGETPLHCASRFNFDKIVSLLLKNGADPSVSDNRGNPAIAWTAGFR